jgi:pimeloyl-ACP methyl ester carboxylesterase
VLAEGVRRLWRGLRRGRDRRLLHVAGDVGSGPAVVLVHGIASSSAVFENLVPLLSPRHRVVSIDILGFGGSPAPADAEYTIEEHVAWLRDTIASLGLGAPFVLVGHSMGALLVSRYAAIHPSGVSRLVLVSPPIYLAPSEIGDPRLRTAQGLYLKAYDYLRANKRFTMRNAAVIARLMPIRNAFELTERSWVPFARSMRNCVESQTTISDIAAVRVPVHIVYGDLDPFLVPAGMRIVGAMQHVTMHLVRANDHVIRKRLARVVSAAVG